MSKKKLGIFFGKSSISIVEVQGKNILNTAQIPASKLKVAETAEKVPEDIKIVAALQEQIRTSGFQSREAILSLSSEDLIIRFFNLPLIPKKELPASISFEVKKYIPFKVEDLIFDFQTRQDKKAKRLDCLFVGIKKETIDKYASIFLQAGLKILCIESSFLSILRLLRLKDKDYKISQKDNIAVVDLSISGGETNITFLKKGFPEFSRALKVTPSGEGASLSEEENLAQLVNEIRISLDYFRRRFPNLTVDKIFFLSRAENREMAEGLVNELGLSSSFIDVNEFIKSDMPLSLDMAKAYGVSLRDALKFEYGIDLFSRQKLVSETEVAAAMPLEIKVVPVSRDVILRGVIAFVLVIGSIYLYTNQKLTALRKEIVLIQQKRPQLKSVKVKPQLSSTQLVAEKRELESRLQRFKEMFAKRRYLTTKLNKIPRYSGKGLWFTQLQYTRGKGGSERLSLKGYCYLGEEEAELDAIDSFVRKLKEDKEFSRDYRDIILRSIARTELQGVRVTSFEINCT